MKTALMYDPVFREHLVGREHPERPERLDAVIHALTHAGLTGKLMPVEARTAADEELMLCHTLEYLSTARRDVASGRSYLSTGDTDITPNSWDVAARAAGGALNAVDVVLTGKANNAFCAVRPPGHHATASRGMGFCLFNNIALAARHAQNKHGVGRVMIVDWDVHHGNGTQEIFYRDGSVFFFSSHQWPLYPGTGRADETGEGAGKGSTMNFPFPAGSGRREILGAVENSLIPAANRSATGNTATPTFPGSPPPSIPTSRSSRASAAPRSSEPTRSAAPSTSPVSTCRCRNSWAVCSPLSLRLRCMSCSRAR